jgi:UDP-N-acetyl-2-amino-2-deoxyglucuronate dehydrogenase
MNVGIIGCGAILPRHLEAIKECNKFKLISLCDIDINIMNNCKKKYKVNVYSDYKEMVSQNDIGLVVISTPNSLHVEQAIYSLQNGCDVLIEKPVSLNPEDVTTIDKIAKQYNRKAYGVLQVRENPAVKVCKMVMSLGLLGDVRGISLVQRWQRPVEYFTGWRSIPEIGGGTLHECGIHYIDIMNHLLGKPNVISSKIYSTKHMDSDIEDTIYSLLDFGNFGGTMEVTISAEPHNLECSLSILGSNGFIKIGGKAMNIIESANFLSNGSTVEYENLLKRSSIPNKPNSYGSYAGSCPNHPQLYKQLNKFPIEETYNSLKLVDEIYKKAGVRYY